MPANSRPCSVCSEAIGGLPPASGGVGLNGRERQRLAAAGFGLGRSGGWSRRSGTLRGPRRRQHQQPGQRRQEVRDPHRNFTTLRWDQDIAAALKAQHRVEIDRHKIDLKEPIKTLGEHQVPLKLHRDVSAHVNVIVTQDR